MTPLRQRFIADMRLRNYSPKTIKCYVEAVVLLAKHFHRSPDLVSVEEIREFQLHLVRQGRSWSRFNQISCALRFFFRVTLGRLETLASIQFGKRPQKLPCVLSPMEVLRFLEAAPAGRDAAPAGRDRVMLQTMYACGLRLSELLNLSVTDMTAPAWWLWSGRAKDGRIGWFRCRSACSMSCVLIGVRPGRSTCSFRRRVREAIPDVPCVSRLSRGCADRSWIS